jgi:asparagine synthase (glutamine-hydrolysing)
VRFAASLPPRVKMKVLDEKYILKQAAGHIIPAGVRRRTKQPYRAPDAAAFLSGNGSTRLPEYVEAMLAPDRIAEDGIFNPLAVSQLVNKVRSGRAVGTKDNMAFVTVLSTQLVVDAFVRSRALAA